MNVVVVDLDDTLLIRGKLSQLLLKLSKWLQVLSVKLEKENKELHKTLKTYDKVIILTGRYEKERDFTEKQLQKYSIIADQIFFRPNDFIVSWKKTMLSRIVEPTENVVWIDDEV